MIQFSQYFKNVIIKEEDTQNEDNPNQNISTNQQSNSGNTAETIIDYSELYMYLHNNFCFSRKPKPIEATKIDKLIEIIETNKKRLYTDDRIIKKTLSAFCIHACLDNANPIVIGMSNEEIAQHYVPKILSIIKSYMTPSYFPIWMQEMSEVLNQSPPYKRSKYIELIAPFLKENILNVISDWGDKAINDSPTIKSLAVDISYLYNIFCQYDLDFIDDYAEIDGPLLWMFFYRHSIGYDSNIINSSSFDSWMHKDTTLEFFKNYVIKNISTGAQIISVVSSILKNFHNIPIYKIFNFELFKQYSELFTELDCKKIPDMSVRHIVVAEDISSEELHNLFEKNIFFFFRLTLDVNPNFNIASKEKYNDLIIDTLFGIQNMLQNSSNIISSDINKTLTAIYTVNPELFSSFFEKVLKNQENEKKTILISEILDVINLDVNGKKEYFKKLFFENREYIDKFLLYFDEIDKFNFYSHLFNICNAIDYPIDREKFLYNLNIKDLFKLNSQTEYLSHYIGADEAKKLFITPKVLNEIINLKSLNKMYEYASVLSHVLFGDFESSWNQMDEKMVNIKNILIKNPLFYTFFIQSFVEITIPDKDRDKFLNRFYNSDILEKALISMSNYELKDYTRAHFLSKIIVALGAKFLTSEILNNLSTDILIYISSNDLLNNLVKKTSHLVNCDLIIKLINLLEEKKTDGYDIADKKTLNLIIKSLKSNKNIIHELSDNILSSLFNIVIKHNSLYISNINSLSTEEIYKKYLRQTSSFNGLDEHIIELYNILSNAEMTDNFFVEGFNENLISRLDSPYYIHDANMRILDNIPFKFIRRKHNLDENIKKKYVRPKILANEYNKLYDGMFIHATSDIIKLHNDIAKNNGMEVCASSLDSHTTFVRDMIVLGQGKFELLFDYDAYSSISRDGSGKRYATTSTLGDTPIKSPLEHPKSKQERLLKSSEHKFDENLHYDEGFVNMAKANILCIVLPDKYFLSMVRKHNKKYAKTYEFCKYTLKVPLLKLSKFDELMKSGQLLNFMYELRDKQKTEHHILDDEL